MLWSNLKNFRDDFMFRRYKNGIQLIPSSNSTRQAHTLNDLLSTDLNIYFLDKNSNFCIQNKEHAKNIGCLSAKEGIGRSISHFATKESAKLIRENDLHILKTEDYRIIEEVVKKDKANTESDDFTGLSFKMPWYNEENKVVGIFGCTIVLGKHSLVDSISVIRELGLLNTDYDLSRLLYAPAKPTKNYFTKRQTEILRLMVRGKCSKEISNLLKISQRTVQHYIDNIKNKLGVYSRSELIDKVFDDFK